MRTYLCQWGRSPFKYCLLLSIYRLNNLFRTSNNQHPDYRPSNHPSSLSFYLVILWCNIGKHTTHHNNYQNTQWKVNGNLEKWIYHHRVDISQKRSHIDCSWLCCSSSPESWKNSRTQIICTKKQNNSDHTIGYRHHSFFDLCRIWKNRIKTKHSN